MVKQQTIIIAGATSSSPSQVPVRSRGWLNVMAIRRYVRSAEGNSALLEAFERHRFDLEKSIRTRKTDPCPCRSDLALTKFNSPFRFSEIRSRTFVYEDTNSTGRLPSAARIVGTKCSYVTVMLGPHLVQVSAGLQQPWTMGSRIRSPESSESRC